MAITGFFEIDGHRQNGVILRRLEGKVGHQKRRVKYWGVDDEFELRGGRDGREITLRMCISNRYATQGQLQADLRRWNNLRGKVHGLLTILDTGNGVGAQYRNVTYEGYETLDDETAGPLPDVAGTLTGTAGHWFQVLVFHFYQLGIQ